MEPEAAATLDNVISGSGRAAQLLRQKLSLVKLWLVNDATPITSMIIGDYDEACENGVCVVGSASTVLDRLSAQL